jgi:hypothetical protein
MPLLKVTRGPLPSEYPASITKEVVIRQIEYKSPNDIGFWSYPSDLAPINSDTSYSRLVATFRVKLKEKHN